MHPKSQGSHILLFMCCIHGFGTNMLRKTFPITEQKRKFFQKSDHLLNSLSLGTEDMSKTNSLEKCLKLFIAHYS